MMSSAMYGGLQTQPATTGTWTHWMHLFLLQRRRKRKREQQRKQNLIRGSDAWDFDMFELPLIGIPPLGKDRRFAAYFVCNPNYFPVRGSTRDNQKEPRPFMVSCDLGHNKTSNPEMQEWMKFICWFLSGSWKIKMWLNDKSISKQTKFSLDTTPDGTLFVRFKELMKANKKC
jgi:hypothetical protein